MSVRLTRREKAMIHTAARMFATNPRLDRISVNERAKYFEEAMRLWIRRIIERRLSC